MNTPLYERVKDALMKGVSPQECAAIFGVSESLVWKMLDRLTQPAEIQTNNN